MGTNNYSSESGGAIRVRKDTDDAGLATQVPSERTKQKQKRPADKAS